MAASPCRGRESTMSELLTVERRLPAVIVTFNRPDKQNALSAAMLGEIDHKLAELDGDPAIRGIVLTGSQKVFSTGGDLKKPRKITATPPPRGCPKFFPRATAVSKRS